MAPIGATLYFGFCAFMGNLVFSAMGFGVGIIFLFVYQLGSLAGLMDCCNLRYAVFALTLGFCIILPLVLWHTNLRQHARIDFLFYFVPVQFIGTPLGQYLQNKMPTSILKLIVGIVTGGVAIWQIFSIYRETRKKRKRKKRTNGDMGQKYESLPTTTEQTTTPSPPEEGLREESCGYFVVGSELYGAGGGVKEAFTSLPGVVLAPFTPLLSRLAPQTGTFGDLDNPANLTKLIDSMCYFIEYNPTPWTDESNRKISFNREQLLNSCTDQPGSRSFYSVLGCILDYFAVANNATTWAYQMDDRLGCHHDNLLEHFNGNLGYVYLTRDPRSACSEIAKSNDTGDSCAFIIAEKWNCYHSDASKILQEYTGRVHQMEFEDVLENPSTTKDNLRKFLEGVDSNTAPKTDEGVKLEGARVWRNHTLSQPDKIYQKSKWEEETDVAVVKAIEFHCHDTMVRLGYEPVLSKPELLFTDAEKEEFRRVNKEGRERWRELHGPGESEEAQDKIIAVFEELCLEPSKTDGSRLQRFYNKVKAEVLPVRKVFIFMMIAGFFSGFFGGLIGVRGPPLIMFFFFFEYPKKQVKANGSIIATANTLIRVITYAVSDPPETYVSEHWFAKDEWRVYVTVLVLGFLGSPCGIYLSRYLNRGGYKVALAALLIVNGITMMITATLDLVKKES